MTKQPSQQKAAKVSTQPGQDAVSDAEVEEYLSGIIFPCQKDQLVEHAHRQGAPQEVLELVKSFPEGEYCSVIDVARGISEAKQ